MPREPAIWFPAVRAGTGADVFTENLVAKLRNCGVRAEIAWLPLRAEYAPWTVSVPVPPAWVNTVHVNTWLHPRFIPFGLPLVATMHHCVHDQVLRAYKSVAQAFYHWAYIRRVERTVLQQADVVATVSQYTADRTRAAFGPMPIRVIPNGVDVGAVFKPPLSRVAHAPFRLLFVGTASRRKGTDLLGPIMTRLGKSFELSIISTLLPERWQLPSNVRLLGRATTQRELALAYQQADALLFPSRLEGFGLVCAEAMACGLPVIATRGSSLSEVVEDGVTGILCPQDNVEAFARAIKRLAHSPDLWAAMSEASRRRAVDRFGVTGMAGAYLECYGRS